MKVDLTLKLCYSGTVHNIFGSSLFHTTIGFNKGKKWRKHLGILINLSASRGLRHTLFNCAHRTQMWGVSWVEITEVTHP